MILFGIAVAEVYEVDILTGTSVVYFYLALVVTIFVVISANLYFNSIHNLKVAKNTFSTLAVTKLSGGKKWLQQGLDLL